MRFAILAYGLAVCGALAAQPALSLRLEPMPGSVMAGESIVLKLHVKASAAMTIEEIELNRAATRIHLERIGEPKRVLTGADHIRLFPEKALAGLGRSVPVNTGAEWVAEIALFQYTRPLAAGRYRCSVEYLGRSSNTIALDVQPAAGWRGTQWRWFGGADAKAELGGISVFGDRWFHHASAASDPSIVLFSVGFSQGRAGVEEALRLAHFEGIVGSRFERLAVWTESGHVCWQPVSSEGAVSTARCHPHGLNGRVKLAEPPLQRLDGGLEAYVFSPSGVVLVKAAADGAVTARAVSARKGLVDLYVVWKAPVTLLMAESASGGVRLTAAGGKDFAGEWVGWRGEQWNGSAVVEGVVKRDGRELAAGWRPGNSEFSDLRTPQLAGENVIDNGKVRFTVTQDPRRGFVATRMK